MKHQYFAMMTVLLLPTGLIARSRGPASTAILEVTAGKTGHGGTPVSFALPKVLQDHESFRLTRLEDNANIAVQRDNSEPPQLVWLLGKKLEAGQTRRYRLTTDKQKRKPRVTCRDNGKRLVVRVGDRPVLNYNHAVVPSPNPKTPYYARSGHLHPVFTPAGKQITDDFAPDHPHQHGFMFAWTNTTYENRDINFWDQKAGTARVEHKKVSSTVSGPVFGGFSTVIRHSDLSAPGGVKPVLSEMWTVRAFAVDDGFLFDLTSTQSVIGTSPLRINQYHYGGPAIRGNRQWLGADKKVFRTSEGANRKKGNHSRPRWVDLHGKLDGAECGIVVFAHPDNFRFPQPVRLHPSKPYFSLSPMVLGQFEIKPQQPYRTRLRFFTHDGSLSPERAERLWNDYAHPPTVRIVQNSEGEQ